MTTGTWQIAAEPWAVGYGSPYVIDDEDDAPADAVIVEGDSDRLGLFDPPPSVEQGEALAFVDGVRRGEANLVATDAGGRTVFGLAGAYAVGAAIQTEARMAFDGCQPHRLAIWGCGQRFDLPDAPGGWSWQTVTVADEAVDAPLNQLQESMAIREQHLAEALRAEGFLVVLDGPLKRRRSLAEPVVGYIKTHHRPLLPPEHHVRVSQLRASQRTALFTTRADAYSCYHRLVEPAGWASAWHGIVRLEVPADAGLEQARTLADLVISLLPGFAGVAHVDPRAPQNLQPVGALERHLRHLLGPQDLAGRAARTAVNTTLTGGTHR